MTDTRPDPLFEEHARTLATVIGPPNSLQRVEAAYRSACVEMVRRGWINPVFRRHVVAVVEQIR
jgi:hypothetical protein